MWIWQLDRSSGGNLSVIADQAHSHHVSTVFIKSSDGSLPWQQFSPQVVSTLKAQGLRVCGWQFLYGDDPVGEAAVGAQATKTGADCLVANAETDYEGKYGQAQLYLSSLRRSIGPEYPLGLSSFPYADQHPAFPYSVFMGPGGAQFNLPLMYWRDIGASVSSVFSNTYRLNRPYDHPMLPLGQLHANPPAGEIQSFRDLANAYGAFGISWWDWQSATPEGWAAISRPIRFTHPPVSTDYATLQMGNAGDLVLWAQEHLRSAGQQVVTDGVYEPLTEQAVRSFQTQHGLAVTGAIDTATWKALLRFAPAPVLWSSQRPASAALPDRGDELHPFGHPRGTP
jgi:hypothetical protein